MSMFSVDCKTADYDKIYTKYLEWPSQCKYQPTSRPVVTGIIVIKLCNLRTYTHFYIIILIACEAVSLSI